MDATTIKYAFWLRFSADGKHPHCSRNMPAMSVGERAMSCKVELPKSLFVRPQLTATITVGEVPSEPMHIDIEAAETALSAVLGATVVFTVQHPEPEKDATS